MTAEPELKGYISRCLTYWRQANNFLRHSEGLKAGELAWGSVVEVVHAVALLEGKRLQPNHGTVKKYIRDLSKMREDEEIFQLFKKGEAFHANFYHDHMDKAEVDEHFSAMEKLLDKLFGIIRETGMDPEGIGGRED